jgi:signal transduction histidine kinase
MTPPGRNAERALRLVTDAPSPRLPVSRAPDPHPGSAGPIQQPLLPFGAEPIDRAVRRLARTFESLSGISIPVEVLGRPTPLPPAEAAILYRAAYVTLVQAWRYSRGRAVVISIRFLEDDVRLAVTDDGVGLAQRYALGEHRGLASMRRAVERAGGVCRLRSVSPHGVRVEVRVPKGTRSELS